MEEEALMELGLTLNEAKVYLTLLRIGPSSANEISRQSGIHRINVYDIIERLMNRGLIAAVIRTSKHYYKASNPRDLMNLLKEKEEKISEILPRLSGLYHSQPSKEEVFYYKGADSVIKAYYMMLEQKSPICAMGGRGMNRKFLKHRHLKWDRERVKRGIHGRVLYFEDYRSKDIGGKFLKVKFLPRGYESPTMIDICGELVLILLATDDIRCIVIKNRDIADSYRNYFELLWNIAKA
jgi:sugar-specific transcriptional regulator TrmB